MGIFQGFILFVGVTSTLALAIQGLYATEETEATEPEPKPEPEPVD
ncbi:MAG: hypothetical protein OEY01_03350 [Desulfobulbaceae bacterium]|nr:hypothetical protein [Desulfobulbaceae bacterium]